ncbi:hypothetical protein OUZ56_022517 [Daphnia magna]|uniref:Uncharacterized protein n=1 Tax=Daphnia magna TaxID=35525 RepID=A0ABR0AWM9_9CRUS|nr:hypothetical protein OUZ56_022517 [Daphnia magna]
MKSRDLTSIALFNSSNPNGNELDRKATCSQSQLKGVYGFVRHGTRRSTRKEEAVKIRQDNLHDTTTTSNKITSDKNQTNKMFFKKLYVSLATGKDALWYSQVKGMAHYGIMGPAGDAFHLPQSPILSNPSTNPAVQFESFNFLIGEILPPPRRKEFMPVFCVTGKSGNKRRTQMLLV